MGLFDFWKHEKTPRQKTIALTSPLAGQVVLLADVPDQVFAGEMMGQGIAIQPKMQEQTLVAPVSGEIISVFPTKHAITLKTSDGIELLIHIGLDTVELEGQGFTAQVHDGDHVKTGDPLLTVDFPSIDQAGYAIVTPLVVTNSAIVQSFDRVAAGEVEPGEALLMMTVQQ